MLVEVVHPTAGTIPMAGPPVKLSATPASIRLAPPLLGQHTEEVLRTWLKISDREIEDFKKKGII